MKALYRWHRHQRRLQKALISRTWRRRPPGAEPQRPLEVVAVVESLLGAPRTVDPGPCGGPPVMHRWPTYPTETAVGRYTLQLRTCQDCGYTEGGLR